MTTLRSIFSTALVLMLAAPAFASSTYYDDRATFEAELDRMIIDDYEDPGYVFIQSNAIMTGVKGETEYHTTGFGDLNIVQGGAGSHSYCAGCNGSFRLGFQSTSVGTAEGVYGVGLEITGNAADVPYFAFVTFADGATEDIALPIGASFWAVTAPELVESVHFGLSGGDSTTAGSFAIDDLTIGDEVDRLCGNGVLDDAEVCDDGNREDDDACVDCLDAFCGDGFLYVDVEECDDGNAEDTDDCTSACLDAFCGDLLVRRGVEDCDDGNVDDTDDCAACLDAACGDGFLHAGIEECDDGNLLDGDGCDRACGIEGGGSDSDTDSDSDADTDTDTGTETDTGSETDTGTETGPDVDADTDADLDADTDADLDADTDVDGDADGAGPSSNGGCCAGSAASNDRAPMPKLALASIGLFLIFRRRR